MLEPGALVLALLVVFLAGTTQSLTGFGFGLVSIPLLTLFISPKLAPAIVLTDAIALNLLILWGAHKMVDLRRMWILMLAGVCGVPLGTWILSHWDVQSLRIYIGVVTVAVSLVLLTGFSRQVKREGVAFVPIGFFSGIMSGSINMGGPPVILFFANQGIPHQVFRANLIAYFFLLQVFAVPFLIENGIFTRGAAVSGLLLLPGLVAGGMLGTSFSTRIHDRTVRNLALIIVSTAGLLSISKGVGIL